MGPEDLLFHEKRSSPQMFSCEFSDFGGPTILQGLLGVCDDPLRVLRGFWPFPGCGGGGLVGCVQGRGLGAHASPSGVFPARRLWWHFACGFGFGHSL